MWLETPYVGQVLKLSFDPSDELEYVSVHAVDHDNRIVYAKFF